MEPTHLIKSNIILKIKVEFLRKLCGHFFLGKTKTYELKNLLRISGAAMGIRKKSDDYFIFTFAVVEVRYGGITTAKILKTWKLSPLTCQ